MARFVRFLRACRAALFGVPRRLPRPPEPCSHEWALDSRYRVANTLTGNETGQIHILRCKKCGEITQRKTGI